MGRLEPSISLQCLHCAQVVRVIHISLTILSHRDQSLVQRLPIRSQIRRSRHGQIDMGCPYKFHSRQYYAPYTRSTVEYLRSIVRAVRSCRIYRRTVLRLVDLRIVL